jgi:hypothetical protein
MGFFSWKCAECGESVMNKHSHQPEDSNCVLVTPNKNHHEPAYDGYGVFNGTDVYELLGNGNRAKGIKMDYSGDRQDLPFRVKLVHSRCHSPLKGYEDYEESEHCLGQGSLNMA